MKHEVRSYSICNLRVDSNLYAVFLFFVEWDGVREDVSLLRRIDEENTKEC